MNEEITATMKYDVPTMMEALRWHSHKANRSTFIVASIALVMFGISLVSSLSSSDGFRSPPALVFAPLPALLLVLLVRWISRQTFARSIQSSPSANKLITYKINDSGIVVDLENGKAEFAWNFFLKSLSTPTAVLLYTQKQAFNWLPKSAFASETDYTRFLQLIAAKTKHSKIG